jgi:MSHA biogenesis protein MshP
MKRNGLPPSQAHRHARGIGALAAILVLVVLSALAASIVKMGWAMQMARARAFQGAQALQAANAGLQWGLNETLHGTWSTCGTGSKVIDLRPTLAFTVSVTCQYDTYNEGESAAGTARPLTVYTLEATACNSTTACPDVGMVTGPNYVERVRRVTATDKRAED